jgi:hypothetical protein
LPLHRSRAAVNIAASPFTALTPHRSNIAADHRTSQKYHRRTIVAYILTTS